MPPRGRKVCAYCGDEASVLTREHVWPKWLRDAIGKTGPEAHVVVDPNGRRHVWWAPLASLTVKKVCPRCNSGWMSRLEGQAKPLLEPMLRCEARVLSSQEQETLARWAVKTTTACDLASSNPATPFEFRRILPTESRIPDGLVVLLARYGGRRFPLHSGGWVRRVSIDVAGVRKSQPMLLLTVSVGAVVLQVFGHGMRDVVDLKPTGPKRDFAQVIWPPEDVCVWPSPRALGDDGLRRFIKEL